jgi:hypothetical protein
MEMVMNIGFTGTQKDINPKQFDRLMGLLTILRPHEVHHGDCVGADTRLHEIVEFLNHENPNYQIEIHVHPPIEESKRSNRIGHMNYVQKEYLVRNHDIVDASDIVIACPKENKEKQRSGTWATYRYATKLGRETYLLLPNGEIVHEGH